MAKKEGMLDSVLKNNKNIKNIKEVILAMSKVDRSFFVSAKDPYIDIPLPIGYGQTISQPTTVARMLCLLDLKEHMDILEIGSGSGWNAALIAFLVNPGKVFSVERIKELSSLSKKNFSAVQEKLGLYNVEFVFADALDKTQIFWKIKYDRIIAAAAASEEFVEELKDMGEYLLNNEGMILFPTESGTLELWQLKDKKLRKIYSEYGYSFVPLVKGTRQF